MTFARIAAFRLVTQQPEALLGFYAAMGFTGQPSQPIAQDELATLGIGGSGTRWPMRLGAAALDLDCYDVAGRPYPTEADAASICFQHLALVTDDAGTAWARAAAAGATPVSRGGPVTLPPSSGGVTAIKFRDPEGHPLELLCFPDTADTHWRGSGMLGVDHSAIVVRNLAVSKAFYLAHGLTAGTTTLNQGAAQAVLDDLEDPIADVVAMVPQFGRSHVELLHYRQLEHPASAPYSVNDVAATRIVWRGANAALLRDPDGHFHQVGG